MPLTDNPITLDPAKFTDVDSEGVARRIFSTLVKFGPDLIPEPDLAERWDISADGRTYIFHIRHGVRFHNGREVVAKDVQYSLERLLRPETGSRRPWVVEPIAGSAELREGRANSLAGVKTPDNYTVQVTLYEPFAAILNLLAMTNAAIVPKEEVERKGEPFGRAPVGSGPFRFAHWNDNNMIELVRNDDYYGGPARIAGIRFRIIRETLVAYQEYLAGNLEHCAVPEGHLEAIQNGPEKAELQTAANLSTWYIGILMSREPCGKAAHLRRALNYAVDREFICNKVLGGAHKPAKGILPPGLSAYNPGLGGFSYDLDRARQEIEAAGYAPGTPLPELSLFFNDRAPASQIVQAIQNDLERIGVRVKLRPMDRPSLLEAIDKSEPDLFWLSWVADFPDADNFLYLFHSSRHGAGGNRVRYTNSKVDDFLERSRRETNAVLRATLLQKAEEAILADAPWLVVSHSRTSLLVKPYIRGFCIGPMDVGTSVNQVDFHAVSFAPPD